jgi:hypothetical protein
VEHLSKLKRDVKFDHSFQKHWQFKSFLYKVAKNLSVQVQQNNSILWEEINKTMYS